MTENIKSRIYEVPSLLTGTASTRFEPSGRLTIPKPWKPYFKGGRAFVFSLRMGEIPTHLMFPEDNFRWLLQNTGEDSADALIRGAEEREIREQARIVLPKNSITLPVSVSVLGAGAYLQVTPEPVGELIVEDDGEVLKAVFGLG